MGDWRSSGRRHNDGTLSATGNADQVEHQRFDQQGRGPGEDALPGPRRHEEPARRGQEAGGGGHRRREAPEEAVGRPGAAGQGVGAQGHDGRPRRRRRAGQGGARSAEGARGPADAVRAAVAPAEGRRREAQGSAAHAQQQDRRGEAQEEHPGGARQAGRGAEDDPGDDRRAEKVEQAEAEAEAGVELAGEMTGDTLQSRFKQLENTGGADMALQELKAKMGLGPATTAPRKELPSAKDAGGAGEGDKPKAAKSANGDDEFK